MEAELNKDVGIMTSNNTDKIIVLKTIDGDITFTTVGDHRIDTVFKSWIVIKEVDFAEYKLILKEKDSCTWDKKVDFINGEFVKVEKYTPEEKAVELEKRAKAEAEAKYSSEQAIAMRIYNDFALQTEPVTDGEMAEVRTYMRAIKPTASNTMALNVVVRPAIMERYEKGV